MFLVILTATAILSLVFGAALPRFNSIRQVPVPYVSLATDPSNPPEVGSHVIPNFEAAWDSAYQQAKTKVRSLVWSLIYYYVGVVLKY
jgi:hypothetical protein